MTKLPSLSAVLPAFNEEAVIEQVLEGALRALPAATDDLEVVVVDDGSTDRTGEIVDRMARRDPRVRVEHHPTRRGYGAALRTGFAAATREFVFYTDADGQFDPGDVTRLIDLASAGSVVSAYRECRRDPLHRKINAWLYNLVLRNALGLEVRDINCAFKLYRAADLQRLTLRSEGALIDAEVLSKLHRSGASIVQVGVPHHPRRAGKQSGNRPRVLLRTVREFVALWPELTGRR